MTETLISTSNLIDAPIGEGDAGVVIRSDLSWQVFNTHKGLSAETMTETQENQGMMLLAISVALKFPAVLAMLVEMSGDPALCAQETLVAQPRMH